MNDDSVPHSSPNRLSDDLLAMSEEIRESDVHLKELMERLKGRVYTLFVVLLSLPFCQPIPLPGISSAFGALIAFLGARYALRHEPWAPKRLLDRIIPQKLFPGLLKAGAKMLRLLEKLMHPRMPWIFDLHTTQILSGTMICVSGILLMLPLPIPTSNLFPSLTVVVLASAISERDGLMYGVGSLLFVFTAAFFALVSFGGFEAGSWIVDWLKGVFPGDPV